MCSGPAAPAHLRRSLPPIPQPAARQAPTEALEEEEDEELEVAEEPPAGAPCAAPAPPAGWPVVPPVVCCPVVWNPVVWPPWVVEVRAPLGPATEVALTEPARGARKRRAGGR